ncbi:MAG: hypothetical protein GY851_34830 [bacterium]|nr:hypothetical protein [bacterium]
MKARIRSDLLPKWEAYAALPQDSPRVFSEMMDELVARSEIGPVESIVVESLATPSDNRWSLVSNALISTGWSEDAPPLTLRMAVPNGEYAIEMEMLVGIKTGYPASAVSIRFEDEAEGRVIKPDASCLDPNGDSRPRWRIVPVGTYTVTDGVLDAVIDEGDPGFWCNIRGFRFTPKYTDAPVLPLKEESERRKQLEALGYLGG